MANNMGIDEPGQKIHITFVIDDKARKSNQEQTLKLPSHLNSTRMGKCCVGERVVIKVLKQRSENKERQTNQDVTDWKRRPVSSYGYV